MRWLIDGYNVIRRDPDLRGAEARGLEAGRAALLRVVQAAARVCADEFAVVFDGAPLPGPAASRGRVQVIFSRPPQKADDVLIRLAAQGREGAVVVSSDRRVQDAARRSQCAVLGAEAFLAGLEGEGPDDGDEEADDRPSTKRGNPHRLSRDARAAQRALRRLRGR